MTARILLAALLVIPAAVVLLVAAVLADERMRRRRPRYTLAELCDLDRADIPEWPYVRTDLGECNYDPYIVRDPENPQQGEAR